MERIPILKIGNLLLVSIQIDLQDRLALALQDDLAEQIVATGARGVLIDISALEIVDSFIGRMLSTIASLSRVLDAETVVVGMRPAVAITLVELGLYMPSVRTALTVEHGLALLGAEVRVAWENGEDAGLDGGGGSGPDAAGGGEAVPSGRAPAAGGDASG
jgi:rsbT antagonist protein RsbS